MAEPTAPNIPNDAPQDVKDFFSCTGDKLVWSPGEVTWLGLKVTPTVDFTDNPTTGGVTINISILGGLVSFGLPATINAAGELVVDTSSVPDLSEWGLGGRADIDAAIKNINDWFKKNGKKLRPQKFKDGAVILEKTPITATPPPPAVTVPAPQPPPTTPKPAGTPKAAPVPPPAVQPKSEPGCGMLGMLLLAMLIGVIALGGGIGFVFFGGPGVGVVATATPAPTSSPTPGAGPTTSALATLTAQPSVTAQPTVTPQPTATATPGHADAITALCARVVHRQFGDFLSYIEWLMYWDGFDVHHFVVRIEGANNGAPLDLVYDTSGEFWGARLGLFNQGNKQIVSLAAVLDDGSVIDITEAATEILGESMRVRYPQEDTFGNCEVFGSTNF
jgi:hypothetical protein